MQHQLDHSHTGTEVHVLNTVSDGFSNYCYIIIDQATSEAFVVDPSWELRKITEAIERLDVKLTGIVLTHAHDDHVNLVDPLISLYKPDVFLSRQEAEYYGFQCSRLRMVDHLERIPIGASFITCLLTPGHTAGGMCYMLRDSLFTGDTLFTEGCGACDEDGASAEQLYDSLQFLKRAIGPKVRVYPGHSFGQAPGNTFETLLRDNLYLSILTRDSFVQFRMRKNQTGLKDFK